MCQSASNISIPRPCHLTVSWAPHRPGSSSTSVGKLESRNEHDKLFGKGGRHSLMQESSWDMISQWLLCTRLRGEGCTFEETAQLQVHTTARNEHILLCVHKHTCTHLGVCVCIVYNSTHARIKFARDYCAYSCGWVTWSINHCIAINHCVAKCQKTACSNNCNAGKLLTVAGNESKMTVTRQKLGPL